jgi:hypothetical protein
VRSNCAAWFSRIGTSHVAIANASSNYELSCCRRRSMKR